MGIEEIGYCGLHCGGCPLKAGVVLDGSSDLQKAQRRIEHRTIAEALAAIPFLKVLAGCPVCLETSGNQVVMRCPRSCRSGGGNPSCGIRLCCRTRQLDGCWQCGGFRECGHLQSLVPAHGRAHNRNLARIRESGIEEFLAGEKHWHSE
jgi:hypothetical protein